MSSDGPETTRTQFHRTILVVAGVVCVVLGSLGLILPLLPTTPFLLLAAFLFARGSDRWHRWLMSHRHLSPYIHAFRGKKGLTTAQKVRIGASFTVLFGVSIYFVPNGTIKLLLAAWWLFWLVFIYRIKTTASAAVATERLEGRS